MIANPIWRGSAHVHAFIDTLGPDLIHALAGAVWRLILLDSCRRKLYNCDIPHIWSLLFLSFHPFNSGLDALSSTRILGLGYLVISPCYLALIPSGEEPLFGNLEPRTTTIARIRSLSVYISLLSSWRRGAARLKDLNPLALRWHASLKSF
ncbi:hypothetical protein L228DRAFT_245528 [Xylona heveae TC161]|uniref:Uncharacterized protein n=1 Tax=Xylona heveae (strain CBS 132557 / TC161) TaxID=1328760 RepID=A0A165I937_XYLHT|nr:hypothetical protein L228DRAFT_245528 [Xylona heveae TC161]KZF24565.1 hypothetical protein L228DRAFT_245528 [Xylona heveae TC161]